MIKPQIPTETAKVNPQAWSDYWEAIPRYDAYIRMVNNKEYRKAYYANKTRLRQIAKLHELMDKYPHEARQHLLQ